MHATCTQLTCFFTKRTHLHHQHLGSDTEPLQSQKAPHVPPSLLVLGSGLYPDSSWPGSLVVPLFLSTHVLSAVLSHLLPALIICVLGSPCCPVTPGLHL